MIKRILPRSLFGRALIILMTPLILVQLILSYIFFERHTDTILSLLASTIAGDIELVSDMVKRKEDLKHVQELANRHLRLQVTYEPNKKLTATGTYKSNWLYEYMGDALSFQLSYPYYLRMDGDNIYIDVQLPTGILKLITRQKHLFSRTTPLVLIWTTASSLLLFIVASLFMRNQIRPLQRLARAADRFGKGEEFDNFRPEGAVEVRKAGVAFNLMRERIRRQIQERMEMLAGVSHDLRTPLTRMKLQLALMPPSLETKNLEEDADCMKQMIEGFLAFSQGLEDEPRKWVDLRLLCEEVIESFRYSPLKIHFSCPFSVQASLKIFQIKRCLTNLLLNSEKYATTVWLGVERQEQNVEITVEDNGPGIPENKREEVFRPFYRLDTSRNQDTGGVGLGLSIARTVIRGQGGSIQLMESPQKGLRVVIRLPLQMTV